MSVNSVLQGPNVEIVEANSRSGTRLGIGMTYHSLPKTFHAWKQAGRA